MNKSRKAFRKLLSLTLSILMVCSVMPIATFSASAEEKTYAVGDVIEFGSYPQTEIKDTAITDELKKLAGSTDNWTSYNYYSSQNTVGDYMKYTDVEYNGEKYRGIYLTKNRAAQTIKDANTNSIQKDNKYYCNQFYWFKYEPIEWVILEAGTGGLAVSKKAIDSQSYCDTYYNGYGDSEKKYYCNNWEHSTIRTWLNSTFINTAFSLSEQVYIEEKTINTPAFSNSYSKFDSADTSDKVFLLSYEDVKNPNYGFSEGTDKSETREIIGTDYALSQGLMVYRSVKKNNICSWILLRSAGSTDSGINFVSGICYSVLADVLFPYCTADGIVPALYINSYQVASCKHNYTAVVTNPTCTDKGFTTHTCTECGDSYVDTYVEATGHSMIKVDAKEATCTENGNNEYYYCSNCENYFKDEDGATETTITAETIKAIGHDWDDGKWTWSEDGKTASVTFACKNDANHTQTVNATVEGTEKTAPTCCEKGTTTYTAKATFNNNYYTDTKDVADINATGNHNWGEWTDGVRACQNENCDATEKCSHDGVKAGETCRTCGTQLAKQATTSGGIGVGAILAVVATVVTIILTFLIYNFGSLK